MINILDSFPVLENINVVEIIIQSEDIVVNQDKLAGTTRLLIRTPGAATLQITGDAEFSGDIVHIHEVHK
jgi:hypothetical protein